MTYKLFLINQLHGWVPFCKSEYEAKMKENDDLVTELREENTKHQEQQREEHKIILG